jgi:hypothetical protein
MHAGSARSCTERELGGGAKDESNVFQVVAVWAIDPQELRDASFWPGGHGGIRVDSPIVEGCAELASSTQRDNDRPRGDASEHERFERKLLHQRRPSDAASRVEWNVLRTRHAGPSGGAPRTGAARRGRSGDFGGFESHRRDLGNIFGRRRADTAARCCRTGRPKLLRNHGRRVFGRRDSRAVGGTSPRDHPASYRVALVASGGNRGTFSANAVPTWALQRKLMKGTAE